MYTSRELGRALAFARVGISSITVITHVAFGTALLIRGRVLCLDQCLVPAVVESGKGLSSGYIRKVIM